MTQSTACIDGVDGRGLLAAPRAAASEGLAPLMIEARGLRKSFGGQVVLDGVDLDLRRGDVVLLRGANGSGKTTLLNILTGNLAPDAGSITLTANGTAHRFRFPRPWWDPRELLSSFTPEVVARAGVGRSWQEMRLFSSQSLRANIAAAAPGQMGENPLLAVLRPFAVRRQDRDLLREADGVLARLGLGGREDASADRVSVGQAKRVAIARAVQAGARVLFLDEPLAGLDVPGIRAVMELLQNLAREQGLTLVIVEHLFNIPRILELATSVWTLEGGRLKVESPQDVHDGIVQHAEDDLRTWLREVSGADTRLVEESLPGGASLTRVIPVGKDNGAGEAVLEVEDLVVHRGMRLVIGAEDTEGAVRGVSFTLRRGELTLIQAPNGWGKTTLLEAVAGLLPITRGRIRLLGRPLDRWPAWHRRRFGLTLLQSRNHTFPALTVRESLRLAGAATSPEDLTPLLARRVADLSGGEKQRVAMSGALAGEPFSVALLDEPFGALDATGLRGLTARLAACAQNTALLIAVPAASQPDSP